MTWLCKVFIPVCLISIWCQCHSGLWLSTLYNFEKAPGASVLANPCKTAIHRWKVINGVISSEENGALEVRLLQRDHPCTVQVAAALKGLHSGTVLRFLGNNMYVLVPKLLPVFSHLSQLQIKLPQDFKISNKRELCQVKSFALNTYLAGRYQNHKSSFLRERLNHCTLGVSIPAISPKVGKSTA